MSKTSSYKIMSYLTSNATSHGRSNNAKVGLSGMIYIIHVSVQSVTWVDEVKSFNSSVVMLKFN